MRHLIVPPGESKGWLAGPWESGLPVGIGYASKGIDEPHHHPAITEVYLVARGTARMRVGRETLDLSAGSVVIVDPGEPHTFLESSEEYLHFVLHVPREGPELDVRKIPVDASELGL